MRLLAPSDTMLEAWANSASWYQQASRLVRGVFPEWQDDLRPSFDALRDALQAEAEALYEVYVASQAPIHQRVADLLARSWAEVLEMSGAEIPAGIGGLGAAKGKVKLFKQVVNWVKEYGPWLLGLWAFVKVGPPIIRALDRAMETAEDREQRILEARLRLAGKRQDALRECGADKACRDDMNEAYDAATPADEECDMLDTPMGTSLGGIIGLLGGVIAVDSAFGLVD